MINFRDTLQAIVVILVEVKFRTVSVKCAIIFDQDCRNRILEIASASEF
jgi:hypothetical protein